MPSAFKRRVPAAAPSSAATGADEAGPSSPPPSAPISSPPYSRKATPFASGHSVLDTHVIQHAPLTLYLPAPDLAHPRRLAASQADAARSAYTHCSSLALLAAAQGLADGARVLVVGPGARAWAESIPAAPVVAAPPAAVVAQARAAQAERDLGSASRYAHLAQQTATAGAPTSGTSGVLDLSRVMGAAGVASEGERLRVVELAEGANAESVCAEEVQRSCKEAGAPLRIFLLSLGEAPWSTSVNLLFRLLLDVRVKSLAAEAGPAHATVLLSPTLLAELTLPQIDRLLSLAETALALSVFVPPLAASFPAYTGALRIINSRGSLGALVSSAGAEELGYRARRRGLGIGKLHLDVGGGVGERRTTAPGTAAAGAGADIEDAGKGLARKGVAVKQTVGKETLPVAAEPPEAPKPDVQTAPAVVKPVAKFGGLAALRARGLQARATKGTKGKADQSKPSQ